MFRLLLKILGLEKYEYPENTIEVVQSKIQSTSLNSQPAPKQEAELEVKPEPKQKIEAKSKPKKEAEVKPESIAVITMLTAEMLIDKCAGLKSNYATMLIDAGFDNLAKIEQASDKELLAIKGIGKATVKLLRNDI